MLNPINPILVVDDEEETLKSTELLLLTIGINNIILCKDSRKVTDLLGKEIVSIILLDLNMPNLSGKELLKIIKSNFPRIPVIVITGSNDLETAVSCMKTGAYDYFLKPVEKEVFQASITRALEYYSLKSEISILKSHLLESRLDHPKVFSEIISVNNRITAIFSYMEAIADSSEPVLITGESGTGKELFARAFYNLSAVQGELVTVNVAGLDDTVFSDTLFGHKKGAFTGAGTDRDGLIKKAKTGILFLDEIGDLAMATQVKLLRLIQEKEYYTLGSDFIKKTDTRIIAATNCNLHEKMQNNLFRQDLYYRLNTHSIHIPALRERMDDLELLIDHFIIQARDTYKISADWAEYAEHLKLCLKNYSFPGNIRELRSIVFDLAPLTPDKRAAILKEKYKLSAETISENTVPEIAFPDTLPTLQQIRKLLITEALKRTDGNQSRAAALLGISHQALSKQLKS